MPASSELPEFKEVVCSKLVAHFGPISSANAGDEIRPYIRLIAPHSLE